MRRARTRSRPPAADGRAPLRTSPPATRRRRATACARARRPAAPPPGAPRPATSAGRTPARGRAAGRSRPVRGLRCGIPARDVRPRRGVRRGDGSHVRWKLDHHFDPDGPRWLVEAHDRDGLPRGRARQETSGTPRPTTVIRVIRATGTLGRMGEALLERGDQLDRLEAALTGARAGEGRLVVVEAAA